MKLTLVFMVLAIIVCAMVQESQEQVPRSFNCSGKVIKICQGDDQSTFTTAISSSDHAPRNAASRNPASSDPVPSNPQRSAAPNNSARSNRAVRSNPVTTFEPLPIEFLPHGCLAPEPASHSVPNNPAPKSLTSATSNDSASRNPAPNNFASSSPANDEVMIE